MTTASTLASAINSSAEPYAFAISNSSAVLAASARSMSATATTVVSGMRVARSRTYTLPRRPAPITPTLSFFISVALVYPRQMAYLVEVQSVRKAFPGVLALDGVSMSVRAGAVHALMGENGAGKSTLMKIVAGLLTPDAGRVVLQGRVAMIHQELHLMP